MKIVKSDRGDEYYKPHQNDVTERCNRTLTEMIRCMLSDSSLLMSLWMEALKTTMYLLNTVPSKAVLTVDGNEI